jgi:hypothetical protein
MAFWNGTQIISINEGALPNDGTGDNIREAFTKVDLNFGNISSQLSLFNQDWTNANVEFNFQATFANITNSFISNATGATSNFTGNTSSANIIANTGLYSTTVTHLRGNTYVTGNIIPTGVGTYNLGTPTMPFGNLYVQNTVSTNQITQSTDAGILKIHANAFIGDLQDTGILGNISSNYPGAGNVYTFFGHQYTTNNFIYKITPVDTTSGNNIVVGGVYGNVQFGSGLFSNTTPSTSTTTGALLIAGGAGIGANITVGGNVTALGNIYSGGSQVVTISSIGIGAVYNGTSAIITGNIVYPSATQSTSYYTGALVVPNGGIGVGGNIVTGAGGGFIGTMYTASQPYITSIGVTSADLTIGTGYSLRGNVQATTIGVTNLTVNNMLTFTGQLTGLANIGTNTLYASGNAQVSNVNSTGNVWAGYYIGNGSLLSGIANNSTFQTLNANVGTLFLGNASTNANLGSYQNTTNANIGNIFNNLNTLTANVGAYHQPTSANIGSIFNNLNTLTANVGAYHQPTNANIGSIFNNLNTLTANVGSYENTTNANIGSIFTNFNTLNANVGSYENTTNANIGSIFTNFNTLNANVGAYHQPTNANIGSIFNSLNTLTANVGSYENTTNANIGTQFTRLNTLDANVGLLGGNVGVVSYISKNALSVGGTLTVTGGVVPSANVTYNLGSSTAWWNTVYGKAVQAQYADLAENYIADLSYEPGTVLVFGGEAEVTTTTTFADSRVAGAISTDPAYLMNSGLASEHVVPIALRGRVPVKVIGPVNKGDLLVTAADAGYAVSVGTDKTQGIAIFAKSLVTDLSSGIKIVEVVII